MQDLNRTSFDFYMKKIITMKAIITICLLIISIVSNAKIIYVKSVDSNAWSDRELVYNDLQNAIDEANDYDSIWIAAGTYYPTASFNGSSNSIYYSITIKKSVSLFGGFVGNEKSLDERRLEDKNGDNNIASYEFSNETVLSSDLNNDDEWSAVQNSNSQWKYENTGENSLHVIYIDDKNRSSTEIEINGISIQGGSASYILHEGSDSGGGITGNISNKFHFIVQDCIFKENLSKYNGSAIKINITATDSSQFIIRNNNFLNNSTAGGTLCFYSSYKATKPIIDISHNNFINNDGIGLQILSSSSMNADINSNTFTHNISKSTGGIFINTNNVNTQTDATINNNTFISNIGDDGGAIKMKFSWGNINIKTYSNSFVDNTARIRGGAISLESTSDEGGSVLFENNIIHSNQTSGSYGGAFYIDVKRNCKMMIRSCVISNNYSESLYGGAIAFYNGYLYCINNLINNNSSGAYISSSGAGSFINNTIAYNDFYGVIVDKDEKEVSIYNTLVVNNSKELNLEVTNIINSNSITGNTDWFKNPPFFVGYTDSVYDFQIYDFNLIANSYAINNGMPDTLNMFLPSTDLEGKPRIIGDTIDIGAYEFQISTYSGSIENNSNISIFPNPCRHYLHLNNIEPSTDIDIYDSGGTKVGSFVSNSSNITLDLSYLERGVYFLRVNNVGTSYQTKILKL